MKVRVSEIIKNFDKYKRKLVKGFPGVENDVFRLLSCEIPNKYYGVRFIVEAISCSSVAKGNIAHRYAYVNDYLEVANSKLQEIILTKGEDYEV